METTSIKNKWALGCPGYPLVGKITQSLGGTAVHWHSGNLSGKIWQSSIHNSQSTFPTRTVHTEGQGMMGFVPFPAPVSTQNSPPRWPAGNTVTYYSTTMLPCHSTVPQGPQDCHGSMACMARENRNSARLSPARDATWMPTTVSQRREMTSLASRMKRLSAKL